MAGATFVNSATSQNNTCNKPASVAAGDLLVAIVSDASGATNTWTISGWTQRQSTHAANVNLGVLTKIATGSEPSSYTVAGGTARAFIIFAYRPDVGGTLFAAPDAQTSGTGYIAASLTPTQADDLEFHAVASQASNADTATSGFTRRAQFTGFASITFLWEQDRLDYASTSATGTITPVGSAPSGPCYVHLLFKTANPSIAVPFISSVTAVFAPAIVGGIAVPFISSVTAVFDLALVGTLNVPFISSATAVFAPTLASTSVDLNVPFISSVTVLHDLDVGDVLVVGTYSRTDGGHSFHLPADAQPGDLIVLIAADAAGANPTLAVTGTGAGVWTQRVTQHSANDSIATMTHTVTGSEPNPMTLLVNGSSSGGIEELVVLCYRGVAAETPDASGSSSSSLTAPSLSASVTEDLEIYAAVGEATLGVGNPLNLTPTTGFAERFDAAGSIVGLYIQDKIRLPASGATGTVTPAGSAATPASVHLLFKTGPKIETDLPFIASRTRVFGVFSLFDPNLTFTGGGLNGESFAIRLAPNGTVETAMLAANLSAAATLLELTGDSGLPTTEPFVVTIDDEVLYVVRIVAGSYRIRRRGMSNTTRDSHTAGADVTWGDSYDAAIVAGANVAELFTADITSSGSFTYLGWLICFDSSQAYLGGDRYPMHVTELVGVFDAGAGFTGANRLDASQPAAIHTPEGVSDDCPAALANSALITTDILIGDVAVVRYTNPEASPLDLGPRSVALQSWFGMMRVDDADHDVTLTDPAGHVVDTDPGVGDFTGSVTGAWAPPVLGPGISPSTGEPTNHDVPYTSETLEGDQRYFTRGSGAGGFNEKGWPMAVLTVRQGNRRVPFWASWDWHDFSYVYCGFGTDCTYAQFVVNRNGILFGSVPEVDLPGDQDIDGPDAVWDDGSYYFGVAWYVCLFNGPYLVAGPALGAGVPPDLETFPMPIVDFGGGPTSPVVTVPGVPNPPVEGGSGGGIEPPTANKQLFQAAMV